MNAFSAYLRSWRLLETIRSPRFGRARRAKATEELLRLNTGWWVEASEAPKSLRGFAFLVATQVLAQGLTAHRSLTAQQLADGVLLAFVTSLPRITQHPRVWIVTATIRLADRSTRRGDDGPARRARRRRARQRPDTHAPVTPP